MERFNNESVKSYDLLAYYYDELLGDKEAFSYWLKYIEEKPFKTVLELASGTGVLAGILQDKGYDVIASDLSKSMKDAAKVNFDGEYKIINMSSFNLDKKFDLIICLCDSFNYLSSDEIKSFFECSYKHLNEGGRLIFDSHHKDRLKEFKDQYIEEGSISDINYQWTISADTFDSTIHEHFTFYTKDGMIQEHHFQFVYNDDEIITLMNNTGFKTRVIKDFIPSEKMLFIGEK